MNGKIASAFVKAQSELTNPKKDTENTFFNAKYADLTECWRACKEALSNNGIAVLQGIYDGRLKTTLIHESGESMSDDGIALCGYESAKNPMQALGSATTYARRYGLCAMVGMSPEDDDGNSLTKDEPKEKPKPAAPKGTTPDFINNDGTLSITNLKVAAKDLGRDVEACADADQLTALLDTSTAIEVMNLTEKFLPDWWRGNGAESHGLDGLIKRARESFAQQVAEYLPNK